MSLKSSIVYLPPLFYVCLCHHPLFTGLDMKHLLKEEVDKVKSDFNDLEDSIRRDL